VYFRDIANQIRLCSAPAGPGSDALHASVNSILVLAAPPPPCVLGHKAVKTVPAVSWPVWIDGVGGRIAVLPLCPAVRALSCRRQFPACCASDSAFLAVVQAFQLTATMSQGSANGRIAMSAAQASSEAGGSVITAAKYAAITIVGTAMPQIIDECPIAAPDTSISIGRAKQRQKLASSLSEIASEVTMALRDASLIIPVFFTVPSGGRSYLSFATAVDPSDEDWTRACQIICSIVASKIGVPNLCCRALPCVAAGGPMGAADLLVVSENLQDEGHADLEAINTDGTPSRS
jgi:hypothetical protein